MRKFFFILWLFAFPFGLYSRDYSLSGEVHLLYELNGVYLESWYEGDREVKFYSLVCHFDEGLCRLKFILKDLKKVQDCHCDIEVSQRSELYSNEYKVTHSKQIYQAAKVCISKY